MLHSTSRPSDSFRPVSGRGFAGTRTLQNPIPADLRLLQNVSHGAQAYVEPSASENTVRAPFSF